MSGINLIGEKMKKDTRQTKLVNPRFFLSAAIMATFISTAQFSNAAEPEKTIEIASQNISQQSTPSQTLVVFNCGTASVGVESIGLKPTPCLVQKIKSLKQNEKHAGTYEKLLERKSCFKSHSTCVNAHSLDRENLQFANRKKDRRAGMRF